MTPETPSMARFQIEQYELHIATYEIEARSVADAIGRLFHGDGDMLDGSEYAGTCDEIGLSLEDAPELAEELRSIGAPVRGSIVPSIRSVRQLEDRDEELAES